MKASITVVIPCYNEECIIERNYQRVKRALEQSTSDYEIIIANDGSTDGSAAMLERIAVRDPRLAFIDYRTNRGMGYACRQMYARASKDYVIQMDADLAMDPEETIPALTRDLAHADCVVGSRYLGLKADYPLRRRIASRCYYAVNRVLFDFSLKDTQSGFFGIRRQILQSLDLKSDGFEIHVEMFAQLERRGCSMLEIPLRFVHQTESGEVSVLRSAPRMFCGSLRIWRSLRAV
jgi:glycosyltransferase involved in cell wall biosynthesis